MGNTIIDLTDDAPVCVRHGETPVERVRALLPGLVDQSASY
ncbi:MAG: hypothetical protein WAK86_07565 [Pseudonocardiaceae bacterium]